MRRLIVFGGILIIVTGLVMHYSRRTRYSYIRSTFGPHSAYVTILKHHELSHFLQGDASAILLVRMRKDKYLEFVGSNIGKKYDYGTYMDVMGEKDSEPAQYSRRKIDDCEALGKHYRRYDVLLAGGKGITYPRFVCGYILDRPNPLMKSEKVTLIELESSNHDDVLLTLRM